MVTAPTELARTHVPHQCPADDRPPPAVLALLAVLQQLAEVVGSMTDQQYTAKPVGVVPSSVGGHVRHCLDHVDTLLAAAGRGSVDYDRRERGTEVETRRRAALEALRRQERQLSGFAACPMHKPLRLTALLSSSLPAVEVESSLGRELAFVVSHTVHHNSLICVMAKLMGIPVPERFGYAPSTIAHLEKTSCAR